MRRAVLLLGLGGLLLAPAALRASFSSYGELAAYLERRSVERGLVRSECDRIADKLASVPAESCANGSLRLAGARSVAGAPLLLAEYPPTSQRRPLGRVLLIGGIHGDELTSVSIVFQWMSILDRFHSGLFHWRIVPLLNPDGLLRPRSQRNNERGVDLNRNFPTPDWARDANRHWVEKTRRNPRRYPGPAAASEPESRFLVDEIESFRPAAIISVHAPHSIVDFDGPSVPPDHLGPLMLHRLGTYPGSLGRYAGVNKHLPVVTIELPSAGAMPSLAEQRKIWVDLVAWLKKRVPEQQPGPPTDVVAAGSAP